MMAAKKMFNPLIFLMSLGAGGISVIPFAFFQYTIEHGKGLITYAQMNHGNLSFVNEMLFRSMEGIMVVFAILHIFFTIILFSKLFRWIGSKGYENILQNPLKNAALVAPFISIVMTMNVFIGPIRYFIKPISDNLQSLMLPALLFWGLLWVLLIRLDIKLLKISFQNSFDVSKISFGWLLHPFALGMLTVTGTGIAAMAKNPNIAHTAAFMSFVSGSMGFFLLIVKLIAIFKSHFAAHTLPEKQFLPSFLIVIPNITLYAISAFRIGHYLEHQFEMHLGPYFLLVIILAFAFETWYLLFGMALLGDYFKKHFFKKEFYITQWGLVCPVVAYAVLGSFLYKVFIPSSLLYVVIIMTVFVAILLFFMLLAKQGKCSNIFRNEDIDCA